MKYEPIIGETIDRAAKYAVALAGSPIGRIRYFLRRKTAYERSPWRRAAKALLAVIAIPYPAMSTLIRFEFNGVLLSVTAGSDPLVTASKYHIECERRRIEWKKSPERAAQVKEAKARERLRHLSLFRALKGAPPWPTWADPVNWVKAYLANYESRYGRAVMDYAHRWARLMEAKLKDGIALADCADEMSHLADSEGITGFQYGCAVSMLAKTWEHGEELRKWHNLKTQIKQEGQAANKSGGVLNPALVTVRV